MSALQEALKEQEKLVGTEVGVANWITVDQQMIDDFARTTHDDQWIHVDPERAARETPVRRRLEPRPPPLTGRPRLPT